MNNRTLGTLALAGAPFFLLSSFLQPYFSFLHHQQFYGLWGTIYISAWMCSVAALQRLKATGEGRFGRILLWMQLSFLLLANFSNWIQLVMPGDRSLLFIVLDSFWPLSNLLMLVVGIKVVIENRLQGWRRFVPLLVGCWFPVMIICMNLFGRGGTTGTIAAVYSAIAWSILAVMVLFTGEKARELPSTKLEFA
ncbi:MAG TPA: hypothetical protein VGN63_17375 [Flavisolibacter sp.]|jgi:hypothetical protein|nr:hypothetical protein [Flavisolibacter sp.]